MAASTTGGIHNWQYPKLRHPEMAASTTGGIQNWRHPWLVYGDRKLPNMFWQVPLIIAIALELSIEDNSKADPRNMCLIIIFRRRLSNGRPPIPFRSSLSRWLPRKFPHLFDDHDMLSDKLSPISPLDVAPTNVPTRGSGKANFTMAPRADGSAPLCTSERSFHKSD